MPQIEAAALAQWLCAQGPDVLWSVDGEDGLAGALSLPCTGKDLAAALVAHGGRLNVDLPDTAVLPAADLTEATFDAAAEHQDDGRVFRLAWIKDGEAEGSWLLVEDTLAMRATA